ncbi:hypothetical protein F4778DRAFT_48032 [Xylariomycetidae sp. FL2044]|nr:hypothetical protein F4778DRAFT_48032 [Xylariomycetidae sp. FL2044]
MRKASRPKLSTINLSLFDRIDRVRKRPSSGGPVQPMVVFLLENIHHNSVYPQCSWRGGDVVQQEEFLRASKKQSNLDTPRKFGTALFFLLVSSAQCLMLPHFPMTTSFFGPARPLDMNVAAGDGHFEEEEIDGQARSNACTQLTPEQERRPHCVVDEKGV